MSIIGSELLLGAAGAGGYEIERSLRFNSADSADLRRTPSVEGDRKTWTWAGWVKICSTTGAPATILYARNGSDTGLAGYFYIEFSNAFTLNANQILCGNGAVNYFLTTQYFRDLSAWYHVAVVFDSTQATASNRLRLYVNGLEITAFNIDNRSSITLNGLGAVNRSSVVHKIGSDFNLYSNCYFADIHFIDGQALDPSSFGEFDDNGVWQPIAYAGTYGTNGFHLPFSDNSTAAALGTDTSGNGNTWTVNNLSVAAGAGNDSLVDSPTNYGTDTGAGGEVRGNYCTFNPLAFSNAGSVSWILKNGNLDAGDPDNCYGVIPGTIGVLSGKYYWELTFAGGSIGSTDYWGIERCDNTRTTRFPGNYENAYWFRADGNKVSGTGSASSYGSSFVLTDKAGIAFDADNGTLTFYKNGTSLGTAFTGIDTSQLWRLVIGNAANVTSITTWTLNAGQRPFAYTAPSGFKALCTTNLPEPTIADGSTAMDVKLYTGNGSTQTISGLNFSPDFVWLKARSAAERNVVFDQVRGAGYRLLTDGTESEALETNTLSAFTSDGFSVGVSNGVNGSGTSMVAWTWDAGSSTVTNTDGSITSQVRANASAGFAVITGSTPSTNINFTFGHGLGVAPSLVIYKHTAVSGNWQTYHRSGGGNNYNLNSTAGPANSGTWSGLDPTSTLITIPSVIVSANSSAFVCYAFSPVAGYSSFGSYVGNGAQPEGPFIYTGFKPAFLMIKSSSAGLDGWFIMDNKRPSNNLVNKYLYANTSDSEADANICDFCANGFKIRYNYAGINQNAATYIYAAFAEHPFQSSRAR
jgi:hypothetical protein